MYIADFPMVLWYLCVYVSVVFVMPFLSLLGSISDCISFNTCEQLMVTGEEDAFSPPSSPRRDHGKGDIHSFEMDEEGFAVSPPRK